MYPYKNALTIIKTFEGFSEKAYPDPDTGGAPYTIGYGTTYYPDGSEVKQGHMCTERKALEYVLKEINVISHELDKLNLGLLDSMKEALISFIHSVGWEAFLYSELIDYLEKQFPDKSPDLNDNERKVWFKAGQSSVVSHLKKILNDKEKNLLNETIIGDIK